MVYLKAALEDTLLGNCLAGGMNASETAENWLTNVWKALADSSNIPFHIYVKHDSKLYNFIYMDDRDRLVFRCDDNNLSRNESVLVIPVNNIPGVYMPAMLAMSRDDRFLIRGSINECDSLTIADGLGFKTLNAIDEDGHRKAFTLRDMPYIMPVSLMEYGWAPLDCLDDATDREGVYVVTDFDRFWPEDCSLCYMKYRQDESAGEFRKRAAGELGTDRDTLYFIYIEGWLRFVKKMESEGFMCM